MAAPQRARDVQIAHPWQARCQRDDCTEGEDGKPWRGEIRETRIEADIDRGGHMEHHRRALARQAAHPFAADPPEGALL